MFELTSDRLRLVPLTLDQLQLLSISRKALEQSFGLNISIFELNADKSFLEEFSIAIQSLVIPMVSSHEAHYKWYTHWIIVHKE